MNQTIHITVKKPRKSPTKRRTISAYISTELIDQINDLAAKTNYSRADLIALLLEEALKRVIIIDDDEE